MIILDSVSLLGVSVHIQSIVLPVNVDISLILSTQGIISIVSLSFFEIVISKYKKNYQIKEC
jgi:hypothetical protein